MSRGSTNAESKTKGFMSDIFNIVLFVYCDQLNYKEKILNLINIGNIELSEDEMNEIYDLIYDFIIWYKKLQ